eukprot:scaffold11910_cov104-Skeletonema_dohrnii-CCMP3373.AAC.4
MIQSFASYVGRSDDFKLATSRHFLLIAVLFLQEEGLGLKGSGSKARAQAQDNSNKHTFGQLH